METDSSWRVGLIDGSRVNVCLSDCFLLSPYNYLGQLIAASLRQAFKDSSGQDRFLDAAVDSGRFVWFLA